MSKKSSNASFTSSSWFSIAVIATCIIVGILIYVFWLGHNSNFKDPGTNHKPSNYLGMMYMGGYIVPLLISFFLMVFVFVVERAITIFSAYGTGSVAKFTGSVRSQLEGGNLDVALNLCNTQKGAVGNVVYEGLQKYKTLQADSSMSRDQKAESLRKEIEEATMLEMPMLQKNLNVLATLASVATLVGLLGTVIGMIRAFAALATSGSPDSQALATGISEALFNTALGISTSALAIIAYNFFTTKIDELTGNVEEVGFAIQQAFNKK